MKITKETLKKIIQEEIQKMVLEDLGDQQYMPFPLRPKFRDQQRAEVAQEREITKQVIKWLKSRMDKGTATVVERATYNRLSFKGPGGPKRTDLTWLINSGYIEKVFGTTWAESNPSETYGIKDYDPGSDPGEAPEPEGEDLFTISNPISPGYKSRRRTS